MSRVIAAALVTSVALTMAATASAQAPAPPAAAPPTAPPPAEAAPAQGYPPGSYPAPAQGYPPGGYPAPQQGYYPQGGYPPPQQGYYPPNGYPAYQPVAPMAPITLPYEDGQPVPAGYHVRTKQRTSLAIAGAATFGGVYVFNLLIVSAADSGRSSSGLYPLLIPVVGPFITIGTADANSGATGLLIMDGLAQSAGVAMFIAGLATHTTELVRNDIATLKPSVRVGPGSAELRWRF